MTTRRLGNSDLEITPVGYGAWAIGGAGWDYGWGHQADEDSIGAIHKALDLGVNWIDTAAIYGLGHSEEVVARALDGYSGARPYVFTKCGLKGDREGHVTKVLDPAFLREDCENSLRRLGVESIDLYQVHWPSEDGTGIEEAWETMAALQKEGKARCIAVSNFDTDQLRRCQEIAPVTSLQPPYSLIHRDVDAEILPYCRENGIGVIVYSPMASGLLTGAMTKERAATLPDDDWRKHSPDFQEPALSRHLALVERLKEIGARHGRSPGEVAVAWTLRNPAVTGAIVGARNARQAEGVMRAGELTLADGEAGEIEAILA